MENEFAKHETDYIHRYEAIGYTSQYRVVDNRLEEFTTKKAYTPEEVTILKEHRYEGMSNPSDMSLLYVIETTDGGKGTILSSYGAKADTCVHEFMTSIPEKNIKDENVLPPDADNN
ncbi:hypothetical protein JQC67_11850 [Aurantibacter crassamenti]|uniref:hypothetical protein n=1 Tax=Aurantibacter crassamenti TaxID=1837375 RepID=UPI001939987B|nr:hypothetical protein [Aurantibacter crassamenti]MBM1106836.1 hypothetical protein [Aurantibacter crassamenti]